jgi:hypothetical protein
MMRKLKMTQVAGVREDFASAQGHRCGICRQVTSAAQQVLDHDHQTGICRGMLCRNCNGLEGKIYNLCNRGKRQFDVPWFLDRVKSWWDTHDRPAREDDLVYPTHKTADEKRIATNTKARKKRAAAK